MTKKCLIIIMLSIVFIILTMTPSYSFFWDGLFKSTTKSAAKKVGKKSIRRITKLEKKIIDSGYTKKVKGKKVCQRNQTFNKGKKDAKGQTNCQRMSKGNAPIGHDNKPIELHHSKQQDNGLIVELMSTEHKNEFKILHRYTNESEIDRTKWNQWRNSYWKERGSQLCR